MILTYLSQLDLRLGWSSWWGVLRGMFVRDCRRVFMCRRSIVSSGVLVVSVPLGVCSRGPSQARTESTCVSVWTVPARMDLRCSCKVFQSCMPSCSRCFSASEAESKSNSKSQTSP